MLSKYLCAGNKLRQEPVCFTKAIPSSIMLVIQESSRLRSLIREQSHTSFVVMADLRGKKLARLKIHYINITIVSDVYYLKPVCTIRERKRISPLSYSLHSKEWRKIENVKIKPEEIFSSLASRCWYGFIQPVGFREWNLHSRIERWGSHNQFALLFSDDVKWHRIVASYPQSLSL